jgi:S1-C subfamily serine protease
MSFISRFAALLLLILAIPAGAEQQDVAATVRGVVRVVIIATNGNDSYFVGHGSGFAVAPDKVLTNAHVVEMLRTERNLALGIIPSEGAKSYGGKVIAYSPGNDLALIQLTSGTLPVSTFFAGAVTDGQHVTAIGYPGAVDRAQGLSLSEMIQPVTPVKTSGNVSMGRSSHSFDTLLHTAPMSEGNSGGPLVDDCGRVLGVNSFGAQTEDAGGAEFGFAVSNREVASFLRQANVQFLRTTIRGTRCAGGATRAI